MRVKALDEWNNPALDGQVGIETSSGQLVKLNDKTESAGCLRPRLPTGLVNSTERSESDHCADHTQMVVQLENGEAVLKLIRFRCARRGSPACADRTD